MLSGRSTWQCPNCIASITAFGLLVPAATIQGNINQTRECRESRLEAQRTLKPPYFKVTTFSALSHSKTMGKPGASKKCAGSHLKHACEWPGCNSRFARPSDLTSHRRVHTDERPFPCHWPNCTAKFKQSSQLTIHRRVHTDERPFACDWQGCTAKFRQSGQLTIHRRVHTSERPFACDWQGCTSTFKRADQLTNHRRVHTGERPFACDWQGCTSTFKRADQLTNHRRAHTGERPFACDWQGCTSTFTRTGQLTIHRRVHTGERPFACDWQGCTAKFRQSGQLTKHRRVHTGERPFACDWPNCTAKFRESGQLTNHRRVHTGERPFACDWQGCTAKFKESGQLTKHRLTRHAGDNFPVTGKSLYMTEDTDEPQRGAVQSTATFNFPYQHKDIESFLKQIAPLFANDRCATDSYMQQVCGQSADMIHEDSTYSTEPASSYTLYGNSVIQVADNEIQYDDYTSASDYTLMNL